MEVDLKKVLCLVQLYIFSFEVSQCLNNLDWDRLEQEVVIVFVVNALFTNMKSWPKILQSLEIPKNKFLGSKHICDIMKNCLDSSSKETATISDVEGKNKEYKQQRVQPTIELKKKLLLMEKREASDGKATLLWIPGFDEAEYQWKRDGEILKNDSTYFGVCNEVLLIKNVCQGREGEYCCHTNDEKSVAKICLEVKFSLEKDKLISKYDPKENSNEVPITWPPVGSSTYVELALVHNDQHHITESYDYSVRGDMDDILEKKRKVKYINIFSRTKNSSLVLVEGRPGCGKTTLTHKITRDWARGPDILISCLSQDYSFTEHQQSVRYSLHHLS